MKSTHELYANKQLLDSLYDSTRYGIFGQLIVVYLLSLIYIDVISDFYLFMGIFIHTFIALIRYQLFLFYQKNRYNLHYQDINKWVFYYAILVFFIGVSWGALLFIVDDASVNYTYLTLAVILSIGAGGLLTLGDFFIVYAMYISTMMVSGIVWTLLGDLKNEHVLFTLMVVATFYFLSFGKKYAKNSFQVAFDRIKLRSSNEELMQRHTELTEQKDKYNYQAHYDGLTSLPNKILFLDRLQLAIKQAHRNNATLAVLFIDLDHFKEINDSFGHETGDKVIQFVTSRMQESIRTSDTLSRFGGDEFSLIMNNVEDSDNISKFSQKLLECLSEPIEFDARVLYISSSIGISIYPQDGDNADDLLKYADAAMHRAKQSGRSNFQFYLPEMTQQALARVEMETNLRKAIKNDEFVIYYQPQVDAPTNKIIGLEALVRWEHPIKGLISPAEFIPIAESTSLIIEIDRIVMSKAIEQVCLWREQGLNPGVLSLNLTTKQIDTKDYIHFLQEKLQNSCLSPDMLELEVTESDVMKNPEESIDKLNIINNLGISIAVDDFGTGYSSLSYLKKLPISKLKIDQSFVRDIPHNEDDNAIVNVIIALSKSLNLKTIAEGVEEKEQMDFLVENGCSHIQGYFYSRPVKANEFERLLKEGLIER